jgi:hypothetical protein
LTLTDRKVDHEVSVSYTQLNSINLVIPRLQAALRHNILQESECNAKWLTCLIDYAAPFHNTSFHSSTNALCIHYNHTIQEQLKATIYNKTCKGRSFHRGRLSTKDNLATVVPKMSGLLVLSTCPSVQKIIARCEVS